MLAIATDDVASNVGVGDLLNGESVAPVTAERIANDAGGRGAYHRDPIFTVVLDEVRAGDFVARTQHADVHRRTAKYEDPMQLIVFDGASSGNSSTSPSLKVESPFLPKHLSQAPDASRFARSIGSTT